MGHMQWVASRGALFHCKDATATDALLPGKTACCSRELPIGFLRQPRQISLDTADALPECHVANTNPILRLLLPCHPTSTLPLHHPYLHIAVTT